MQRELFHSTVLFFPFADVKLSQLGRVENVYSTDPGYNMTGLYNLQLDIPDDSMITSFCAFGVIRTDGSEEQDENVSGRLVFLVVRSSDQGPVILPDNIITLIQDNASAMEFEVCVNTNININRGSQVSILVAIPSSCVKESGSILCPLQVHFQANDSDIEYYSNSNVDVDDFFVDGNISTIIDLLNSTVNKVMTNTSINVRVDIETEGTNHEGKGLLFGRVQWGAQLALPLLFLRTRNIHSKKCLVSLFEMHHFHFTLK